MPFAPSSRARLTRHDLGRFPGDTLFDRIARAVCEAGCLPRKELFEAWEVAKRVRRLFRGGRVVDIAGGHGLLAQVLLLLDATSPSAMVVERTIPPSAASVNEALAVVWPRLTSQVEFVAADLGSVALASGDLIVASHACGALTDAVLARAIEARARVAVLPCCHDLEACDAGALGGWMAAPLAVDVMRAVRLEQHGYRVWTQSIPDIITPQNRLLLGQPGLGGDL
ncbi:MAG: methyltransferase domain-containing protein [Acidobacteria bacterium]|nr:methyltransferase domain-containing protein [Acidobacteriota bacterium]